MAGVGLVGVVGLFGCLDINIVANAPPPAKNLDGGEDTSRPGVSSDAEGLDAAVEAAPDDSDSQLPPTRTCPALVPDLAPPRSCAGLAKTCGANDDCCASSVIPAGTFDRGPIDSALATISAVRLDDYEVTVGRFRDFVAIYTQDVIPECAGRNTHNPDDLGWDPSWNALLPVDAAALKVALNCDSAFSTWTDVPGSREDLPINCVTWFEAEAFCTWDHGRLPTDAEWNYAADGGSELRAYPWGSGQPGKNANLAVQRCYYGGSGTCVDRRNIAPVGSVSAGNAKWGQADMVGNVAEWIQDWDGTYPATCDDCAKLNYGQARVLRGGSYDLTDQLLMENINTDSAPPMTRSPHNGVRCARNP
jgi:formylglycine-generating enzyme required for sulfatase activity